MSDNAADYEVGYKRPPRDHQFKKGEPSPRKGKPSNPRTIDIGALLREPIEIKVGDKRVKVDEFRARLRSFLEQAIKGDVTASREVLRYAERGELLPETDEEEASCGIVVVVPKDWDHDQWMANYAKYGLPPWRTKPDGLLPPERRGAP